MTTFHLVPKEGWQDFTIEQAETVLFETQRDRLIRPQIIALKGDEAKIRLTSTAFKLGQVQYELKPVLSEQSLGMVTAHLGLFCDITLTLADKQFYFNGKGWRNILWRLSGVSLWFGLLVLIKKTHPILYPITLNDQLVGVLKVNPMNRDTFFEMETPVFTSLSSVEQQAVLMAAIFVGG